MSENVALGEMSGTMMILSTTSEEEDSVVTVPSRSYTVNTISTFSCGERERWEGGEGEEREGGI